MNPGSKAGTAFVQGPTEGATAHVPRKMHCQAWAPAMASCSRTGPKSLQPVVAWPAGVVIVAAQVVCCSNPCCKTACHLLLAKPGAHHDFLQPGSAMEQVR